GTRLVKVRPFRWRPLVRARPRIERAGQRADGFTLLAALPVVEHTIVVWSLQIAEHGQPPVKLLQNFRVIEVRHGRRWRERWGGRRLRRGRWQRRGHWRPGRGVGRRERSLTIRTGRGRCPERWRGV